jgi:magnesium-transporting ATPase (P-type)
MSRCCRYLIIGMYVGLATAWGFLWWYLWYSEGPKLSYKALSHFQKCDAAAAAAAGYKCEIFSDNHPKTVAMTVLVIVEMFNALNNISENSSLLVIPFWDNKWLLGAIAVSVILHCIIMYVPGLALLFGITHLNAAEWWCVILLSAPVILVDEVLKWLSRRGLGGFGVGGNRRYSKVASMGQMAVPLTSIQVTSPLLGGGLGPDKSH